MSLFDIQRVTVGPKTMVARVRLANGAPVKTSEDLEGTSRVYHLMPQIADHACVCDKGDQLRDSMGDTELAHLLEHVALEFLARLGVQDISVGRTIDTNVDRTWDIELTCPDDAMTLGALSSAAWLLEWAYSGGADPAPDVENIVEGLRALVKSLPADGSSPAPAAGDASASTDDAPAAATGAPADAAPAPTTSRAPAAK
ncbi:hypothetical protein I3I95_07780 [bacterium]|nr:hypothetical protein [bacterium]